MTERKIKTVREFGFTLIEVLMVVVIIGILGTVAMRSLQSGMENSRVQATQTEIEQLVMAIAGNPDLYANGLRSDFGYLGDVGALPTSLDDLVSNPGGYATWDGPYVGGRFTEDAAGFKTDAWGNTYTFTGGVTISSTGGGSTPLTTSVAAAASDLTNTTVEGTVTDAAGNPPGDSSVAVSVVITYPDGAGSTTSATVYPGSGGSFSLTGIPVGVQTIEAIYRATDDTVTAYAAVLPRTGTTLSLRLPGNPFAAAGGGGGGGSSSIEYVTGTAQTTGAGNDDIQFDIINNGGAAGVVSSLTAVYSTTGYFRYIQWDGTQVFDEWFPRAGSGDACVLGPAQTINVGQSLTVKLESFNNDPLFGSDADMSNTDFTITFSEGSVINFNSGP